MAKLVFGLNQSLDGYVDHTKLMPDPAVFRHFVEQVRHSAGTIYGRRMYEIMRYWEQDQADWNEDARAYAAAWRRQPKWVVSRTLDTVGPNATLVRTNVEAVVQELKVQLDGEIEVAGPDLAHSLGELGLVDEYRLYIHPVVLGQGRPFFAGPRPPLRFISSEKIGDRVVRLVYAADRVAPPA